MTIAPIVLKGKVTEARSGWCDIYLVELGKTWTVPHGFGFPRPMVGEFVTITITPDNPTYGSQVLKDIQEKAEEV